MSTSCTSCAIATEVADAILKIDTRIRNCVTILFVYVIIVIATIGIIFFLASQMWMLYSQWRVMASDASPQVDSFVSATSISIGDNEVYGREAAALDTSNTVMVGQKIDQGMAALEATYAAYNKQIGDYAKNVLKKPADDLFDRGVLDRGNDDWV